MPVKSLTTDKTYLKLLTDLQSILIQGLRIIEHERVKTYWRTGEMISKYLLEGNQRGDRLFDRLSEDLHIDKRTLERSVQFYNYFPNAATWPQLKWSHCKLLLSVSDRYKRELYQKKAADERWTVQRLKLEIKKNRKREVVEVEEKHAAPSKLRFVRGSLYNYRLMQPDYISKVENSAVVDCGFYINTQVEAIGVNEFKPRDIVSVVKTTKGSYIFKRSDAENRHLYTYKALVERVVDADTIWVNIDVGFSIWIRQKLRLRAIDAPELSTKKGERAKKFVEARLAGLPFIIIKTSGLDKYGRYLADVFYSRFECEPEKVLELGEYLNQELLDTDLAKVV